MSAPAHSLPHTLGESLIASAAAGTAALLIEVPVWAMFIGWIGYFSRGINLRQGVLNLSCILAGLGIGVAASLAMAALNPLLGAATLPTVVFVVALVVLTASRMTPLSNPLGYFLGLVCWFAAHQPPSMTLLLELAGAALLGTFAGWAAASLPHRAAQARTAA
jgi:hypothetical protein